MALEEIIQKLEKIWRKRQVAKDLAEYLGVLRSHGQGSDEEYLAYVRLIGKNSDYSIYAKSLRRQYKNGIL